MEYKVVITSGGKKRLHIQSVVNPTKTACGKIWSSESDQTISNIACKRCLKRIQQDVIFESIGDPLSLLTKTCTHCGSIRPIAEFNLSPGTGDGLDIYCKPCARKDGRDGYHRHMEKIRAIAIVVPDKKVCEHCKSEKPESEFFRNSYRLDGLSQLCKECLRKISLSRIVHKDFMTCSRCNQVLPANKFAKSEWHKHGRRSVCNECRRVTRRSGNEPINARRHKLISVYGIDEAEYERLFSEQNGVCAICHEPETAHSNGIIKKLSVDHCHESKEVRGLLCSRCNSAIGLLNDDPELLRRAAEYLLR
jgi:hypothetical protein